MTKYQAKTEAMHIAASLCTSCDMGMWDDDYDPPLKDQEKIMNELQEIGWWLERRAKNVIKE